VEAQPADPARRKTPVRSFLLGSVSVGATSSKRPEGAFSKAEAATSDKYCRSASGLWKEAIPPAFSCGQDACMQDMSLSQRELIDRDGQRVDES